MGKLHLYKRRHGSDHVMAKPTENLIHGAVGPGTGGSHTTGAYDQFVAFIL